VSPYRQNLTKHQEKKEVLSLTDLEESAMKKLALVFVVAFSLGLASPLFAGGPKESHPCYEVADCKTMNSRKEFSNCVKANKAEADANAACAEFRKDKPAYMNKHGIANLEDLFN
jgi:hypothetical protein